jgi:hypothetical protein
MIYQTITVLTAEQYIGNNDNTHTITTSHPNETVDNIDSISEMPGLLNLNSSDFSELLDGPENDCEVMSNADSMLHQNKDIDSDFELDGAFGLSKADDPFLEAESALFLETYVNSELSGVLLLTEHIACSLNSN